MPRINIAEWWNELDRFDEVTRFLRDRGLLRPARTLLGVVAISSALVPISFLLGSTPRAATVAAGALAIGLCGAMTWISLKRWPTRRQSLLSISAGIACVAGWSLAQPTPTLAVLACAALAVTGGYVAYFHNFRMMLLNSAVAAAVLAVGSVRLARHSDVATALASFWLVCMLVIAVSLAIRGMGKAMATFASRSDEDPLTGLLNRRGFFDVLSRGLAERPAGGDHYLSVLLIDLDDFKRINDTYGHAAGDRALLDVADLLHEHAPSGAAVCRCGGEEFLIAFQSNTPTVNRIAARLCDAIRAWGFVSASIGAAAAQLPAGLSQQAAVEFIDGLIQTADLAMYEAKRNGGDRVHLAPHTRAA